MVAPPVRTPCLARTASRRCPAPSVRPDAAAVCARCPPARRLPATHRPAALKDGSFGGPSTSFGAASPGPGTEALPEVDVATDAAPAPSAADWAAWTDAPDVPTLAGSADADRIASFASALAGDAVSVRERARGGEER